MGIKPRHPLAKAVTMVLEALKTSIITTNLPANSVFFISSGINKVSKLFICFLIFSLIKLRISVILRHWPALKEGHLLPKIFPALP